MWNWLFLSCFILVVQAVPIAINDAFNESHHFEIIYILDDAMASLTSLKRHNNHVVIQYANQGQSTQKSTEIISYKVGDYTVERKRIDGHPVECVKKDGIQVFKDADEKLNSFLADNENIRQEAVKSGKKDFVLQKADQDVEIQIRLNKNEQIKFLDRLENFNSQGQKKKSVSFTVLAPAKDSEFVIPIECQNVVAQILN